jgi:hypothetical protein
VPDAPDGGRHRAAAAGRAPPRAGGRPDPAHRRLRDLLACIHPGLERIIDATNKADLALLARYITPTEIRRAGRRRLTEYLRHVGGLHAARIGALVEQALAAAQRQRITVPGETVAADLVRDVAHRAAARS